jgi:hypothetical protein
VHWKPTLLGRWGCAGTAETRQDREYGKILQPGAHLAWIALPFNPLTMSGIEVVGLVFGVLPILVETIKAYSTVADGLHTFRHYSKETKTVALKLTVQHGIFLNHCRLLLRLVGSERVAEDMLDDVADERWTSKELNDRLNAVLRNSFILCRSIIEETKGVVSEMKTEMQGFDELETQKKKVRT